MFLFRLHHSEMGLETRIFVNGTPRFGRTGPTSQRGPPPEVVPNIPIEPNQNRPFHLTSARNFRTFWHNGKHPSTIDARRKLGKSRIDGIVNSLLRKKTCPQVEDVCGYRT